MAHSTIQRIEPSNVMASAKFQWKLRSAQALQKDPAMREAWDHLNAQRGDLPFLSADTLCAALTAFGSGHERLATAVFEGRIVAAIILVPSAKFRWSTFQPSQVPLGAWVAEPQLDLPDLTRSLIRGPLGFCLALSITQVDPLVCQRPDVAADFRCDDYIDTAWVEIVGTFDDYWAARGKNLRQNMRKQRNKLAADGQATRMRVISEHAEIGPALSRYGALESAGWKAAEGTAIHPDNAQGRFYIELFEQAAARGEAVFYEYLLDEKTVAMNLCLLRHGQLIVLKTTYDESTNKALSPAFLLREEELQSFFSSSLVRRVEYFGKVMDWHTKLTQESRSIYHFTQFRWAWLRRLAERKSSATAPATVLNSQRETKLAAG
jgi:hypothetical protein